MVTVSEDGSRESKVSADELLRLFKTQSEEARESTAMFARKLQEQQEQYQKIFDDMQQVLQTTMQQQELERSGGIAPSPPPCSAELLGFYIPSHIELGNCIACLLGVGLLARGWCIRAPARHLSLALIHRRQRITQKPHV